MAAAYALDFAGGIPPAVSLISQWHLTYLGGVEFIYVWREATALPEGNSSYQVHI